MTEKVTLSALQQKKDNGEKIVGVVAWDYHMAQIVDRVGVDIVSVGDTVGHNLWGQADIFQITMDEMITVTKAVRRGVKTALLSADFPYGPVQESPEAALAAAKRFVDEAGVDMIKVDDAADHPQAVHALVKAGIPVWAQFGLTPQSAKAGGMAYSSMNTAAAIVPEGMAERLIGEAKMLEDAGSSLLDFTNSGPVVGPVVVDAVKIPVIGGFGGGPWLDGRVRMANAAIGYNAKALDRSAEDDDTHYTNVAKIIHQALSSFAEDVRAGKQIKGTPPAK